MSPFVLDFFIGGRIVRATLHHFRKSWGNVRICNINVDLFKTVAFIKDLIWELQKNQPNKMNLYRCKSPVVALILAIIILMLSTLSTSSVKARMKICLKNCGQCKRIYGDYFEGRRCADSCVIQKGRFIPDCHDDYSISDFISKLE
ncbi:Eclosion hormone [Orchesella cincta]|uniref:Eclosion hormone n=1 Tax=Orchesella cincta TaxID=48709 RepID=A0A1D2MDW3_ORCCI|nr:Eclosion hormone [Orchesella cincta]